MGRSLHLRAVQVALACATVLAACASVQLKDGVVQTPETVYQLFVPPQGWSEVKVSDNDVAFQATGSPHLMAVNSTCEGHGDPGLAVLTRHLLMGFTHQEIQEQSERALDGRSALSTRVVARLDGVPTDLQLIVLKKDGCIYDFTYLSPVGRFEEKHGAFAALVAGFGTRGRR